MTFAVGRISKCMRTLKLKLLVFLFCSPEVGLSYHVKCADRSAPCPNLRVSANRPIVHFGDERQFPLKERFYLAKLVDFKRLSLGGYGGLRCIKSIWVDRPGPGDQIPRSVGSNSNVYSREGARKRGPFHFRWLFSKSIDS